MAKSHVGDQFFTFVLEGRNKKRKATSCELCQKKKVKCEFILDDGVGCKKCKASGLQCSLTNKNKDCNQTEYPLKSSKLTSNEKRTTNFMSQVNNMDWLQFLDDDELDFLPELSINNSPGLANTTRSASTLPLDSNIQGSSNLYYGPSGEYDPWLRFNFYKYDPQNECFFSNKIFRRLGSESNPVIFSFKSRSNVLNLIKDIQTQGNGFHSHRNLLSLTPNVIILYLKFAFEYLPILDGEFLNTIFSNDVVDSEILEKNGFGNLLFLLLTRFVLRWESHDTSIHLLQNDGKEQSIFNDRAVFLTEAWNQIMDLLHSPDLSTVKSLILFYHLLAFKKDAQSNTFEKCVISNLVTVSYTIGLHLDCLDWDIPLYEKRSRIRIWWTVYLLEKWTSAISGTPSMIGVNDFNVRKPSEVPNLFSDMENYVSSIQEKSQYFSDMVELTLILYETCDTLFSIRSLSNEPILCLSQTDLIEVKLHLWLTNFKENNNYDNTVSYNHTLSYYNIKILLYRARFKSLGPEKFYAEYFRKGISLVLEIINFLQSLPQASINGFWYIWQRSCFMFFKDFFLTLLMIAKNKNESLEILLLIKKFREWLEQNCNCLDILWTALLSLNIATQSIGTQFKQNEKVV